MAQTIHNLYINCKLEEIAEIMIRNNIPTYEIEVGEKRVIFDVSYYVSK